jgi:uncharacterized membrane protein
MMPANAAMKTPLSRWAWWCALISHILLAGGLWYWAGALSGFLLTLPLWAALPGLIKRSTYTGGWTTLLLVFYVAVLLAEAFTVPARRQLAANFSELAMVEFVALVLFIRFTARERRPAQA